MVDAPFHFNFVVWKIENDRGAWCGWYAGCRRSVWSCVYVSGHLCYVPSECAEPTEREPWISIQWFNEFVFCRQIQMHTSRSKWTQCIALDASEHIFCHVSWSNGNGKRLFIWPIWLYTSQFQLIQNISVSFFFFLLLLLLLLSWNSSECASLRRWMFCIACTDLDSGNMWEISYISIAWQYLWQNHQASGLKLGKKKTDAIEMIG